MNEKIKELFKRAGGKTSIHNLMSNPMQQREYSELWDDNIQKFAELIVLECIDVMESKSEDGVAYVQDVITGLEKHFGVEE